MIFLFKGKKINSGLLFLGIGGLSFLFFLIAAAITVALVNVLINDLAFDAYTITLIALIAVSMILTCGVVIVFYIMARKAQILINGLKRVGEGDFSAEIELRRGDAFLEVYRNFNAMTEELRSVRTMREDFVRDFSHEIKTPLFSIQGFANLLIEGGLSEDDEKRFLQIIADEAGRLGRLADNTLVLSKLANQHVLGESKPLKLDANINDCIVMLEREWDKKGVEISADLQPVQVTGDSAMLKQVWINLLSNAIKFTPAGGKIEVELKKQGGKAVAKFSDNGCGISPEDIPRIFDKYYRASSAKDTDGNGLGLAICKRICDLSGGKMSVESKVGAGTTFTVELPI